MNRRALVFICCSPDARTGVSTTARLLTDYLLLQGAPVEGFDTDPHEPCYADFFPSLVRIVDASNVRGQISLFDRLLTPDQTPRIVDVWNRSYRRFFDTVRDIGFMEEAVGRGIDPVLLYHADASETALAGARDLVRSWPDLRFILVHNEGAAQLGPDAREILAHYPGQGKFVIGELNGAVAKTLSDRALSFSDFLTAPPASMSIVVRAALKAWILPIFTQFKSFELRLEMESSLFSGRP
ncbi:MAG TPA: hypothetical protein VK446_04160 [Methylocystis sp.]|nr:hypothetical protein [Methylocystis sp.]